jgi:EAL domain-containing protein (putative c-di-GMP-specific phosphodiesterase class I)
LALLRERGCHVIQGYLISKPLPADELTALLGRPTGTLIV